MSRPTSPSRRSIDMAAERSNTKLPLEIDYEQENTMLKKQLRQAETDHRMTKALLEQKIELLESQISEFQARENNLKKMNETIMFALNDINTRDQNPLVAKAAKELELATERHNKEMQDYRNRTTEVIKNLEAENKTLKENANENELRVKELTLHFEKAQMGYQQGISELEQEKASLETKIKRLEEEKQQAKELSEYETIVKVNEMKNANERLKEEHKNELQRVKEEFEKTIQEMRNAHESEKKNMENRVTKMQELLIQEGIKRENVVTDLHNRYQSEIQALKDVSSQMKTEHIKEVNDLKRQKEDLVEKAEKLDAQVKKLKVTLKNSQHLQEQNSKLLKEKLEKAKSVIEHGETLVEENKKYKQKINELKSQIKKLEASEQKLKESMYEKDLKIGEERLGFQKALNFDQSSREGPMSQSANQPRSARQNSGVKPLDTHFSTGKKNSAIISPRCLVNLQPSGDKYSPINDMALMAADLDRLNSHRSKKSDSSPIAVTPPKLFSKSPTNNNIKPVSHKREIRNSVNLTEATERKYKASSSKLDDLKTENDVEAPEGSMPPTSTNMNRATQLETSFADHGFVIENETSTLNTEAYAPEKGKENKGKKFERQIDIDSMPINYSEFMKRTQRSKSQHVDPERILNNEIEPNMETDSENNGPQIFFTTAPEENNQPLFGTSHFVMATINGGGNNQGEGEVEVDQIGFNKEKQKVNKEEYHQKHNRYDDEYDYEKKSGPDSHRRAVTLDDMDLDIPHLKEEVDSGRLSVNLRKRGSSSKSHLRDDLETRPSLMNPMHSVNSAYDAATDMMIQDPQASINFLSANPKSMVDREREKERLFTSRHSFSGSVSGAGAGGMKNSGSRQKIEGRLKDLEWKLKEMELRNKGLRAEKDKVQLEFEKLMADLREKRAESENMKLMDGLEGMKRGEKEAELKSEIKFLINKLLKVKNKLEKQSEELNITKNSNVLGSGEVNNSLSGYHIPTKKDYSKEYGTLGGSNNLSFTTQIKEIKGRENWSPMGVPPSNPNEKNKQKNQARGTWNGSSSQLDTSGVKPENYRASERMSTRSVLGVAVQNFTKNIRSRSNTRYEPERELHNVSIQSNIGKNYENHMVTTKTKSSKVPQLPKHEDVSGPWLSKDVLKNTLNIPNYEVSNAGNGNNVYKNNFLYHRKSTR